MTNKDKLQAEIIAAGKAGDIETMYKLMEQGANPFAIDEHGRSAGSYAAEMCPDRNKIKELAKYMARFAYSNSS